MPSLTEMKRCNHRSLAVTSFVFIFQNLHDFVFRLKTKINNSLSVATVACLSYLPIIPLSVAAVACFSYLPFVLQDATFLYFSYLLSHQLVFFVQSDSVYVIEMISFNFFSPHYLIDCELIECGLYHICIISCVDL